MSIRQIDYSQRVDQLKAAKLKSSVAGIDRMLALENPTEVYEVMHGEVFELESLPVSAFKDENYPLDGHYCHNDAFREAHPTADLFEAGPELYLVPSTASYNILQQLPAKHPESLLPTSKNAGSPSTTQETLFPYPGGKGRFADEITACLPSTRIYVEPFAGSASVFFNRDPSPCEILNDINSDIYTFFKVAKEQPGALVNWVEKVPYARQQYEAWVGDWMAGERPDDPVEQAGRFWVIQQMNQMGKLNSEAGFKTGNEYPASRTFYNAREHLKETVDRFADVTIENRDWLDIIDIYDHDRALFYCDPPYLGKADPYGLDGFDHEKFATVMEKIDGRFAISYESIPSAFNTDELVVVDDFRKRRRQGGQQKETREQLVLNYDPDTGERVDISDPQPGDEIADIATDDSQQTLNQLT
jgi:DNA adenine methylase